MASLQSVLAKDFKVTVLCEIFNTRPYFQISEFNKGKIEIIFLPVDLNMFKVLK